MQKLSTSIRKRYNHFFVFLLIFFFFMLDRFFVLDGLETFHGTSLQGVPVNRLAARFLSNCEDAVCSVSLTPN